jgi:hypothetical protein
MTATTVFRCHNCGVDFDAPEGPCPKPSPGVPYADCGRGGHWFVERPAEEFVFMPATPPARRDFADGSAVVPSVVPGYWRALLPDGQPCRVPDAARPHRACVALFPSPEDAVRHLNELGFAVAPAEAT